MRQTIFTDKQGNVIGEFAHNPVEGFKAGRRGLRRRLMTAAQAATYSPERLMPVAQDLYDNEEKRIREKAFVANEKKAQAQYRLANITLSEAAQKWRAHLDITNSAKTIGLYFKTIRLYLEIVGDHRLKDFSRDHNLRFLAGLQQAPSRPNGPLISITTQHTHLRQLNNFLRWAYDNELIDKQHRLKKPKLPEKDMLVFSVDQLATLKAHLMSKAGISAHPSSLVRKATLQRAFMLATNCLLRVGAVWSLPLSAIDLDARVIRIADVPELGWKNKASKWPTKPINQALYDFLKEDLASRGAKEKWFLDDGQGALYYSAVSALGRNMSLEVKACGLPTGVKPFHWGMRAAMITYLLNNGVAPQMVQQLADHSDLSTTMKYYNTREASQRAAVDLLPSF